MVDARHHLVGRFGSGADDRHVVRGARRRKPGIAPPAVGVNGRARLDGFPDELPQALGGDIVVVTQPNASNAAPTFLGRNDRDSLVLDLAAPRALFRAAHIGFVDLDFACEAVAIRPDCERPCSGRSNHGPAPCVRPRPGRLVATQAHHSLQAQSAYAILLAGHEPQGRPPHPQRLAGVLEHRTSGQRRLRMALLAHQYAARRHPRLPTTPAPPAHESARPSHPSYVVQAAVLGPEPIVHLLERARVIDAGDRSCIVHGATVSMMSTWVKGIPICRNNAMGSTHRCGIRLLLPQIVLTRFTKNTLACGG